MSDVVIRRGNGDQLAPAPLREWAPLRKPREQKLAPLWPMEERELAFTPDFDVKESKESYVFIADLPGVKEKDIEISVAGCRLSVRGKRELEKEEKADTYYSCERSFGSF